MKSELDKCEGNIVVEDNSITSDLQETCPACGHMACGFYDCVESRESLSPAEIFERIRWNSFVDGLESLILALSCDGYDVTDSKFQTAVQTAIQAGAANTD